MGPSLTPSSSLRAKEKKSLIHSEIAFHPQLHWAQSIRHWQRGRNLSSRGTGLSLYVPTEAKKRFWPKKRSFSSSDELACEAFFPLNHWTLLLLLLLHLLPSAQHWHCHSCFILRRTVLASKMFKCVFLGFDLFLPREAAWDQSAPPHHRRGEGGEGLNHMGESPRHQSQGRFALPGGCCAGTEQRKVHVLNVMCGV